MGKNIFVKDDYNRAFIIPEEKTHDWVYKHYKDEFKPDWAIFVGDGWIDGIQDLRLGTGFHMV